MGAAEHREFLHQHGKRIFRLTPGAIISAARSDLQMRARKCATAKNGPIEAAVEPQEQAA